MTRYALYNVESGLYAGQPLMQLGPLHKATLYERESVAHFDVLAYTVGDWRVRKVTLTLTVEPLDE